ncbi:hypothetical protein E2C01_016218 [Portunus trituberculatus]|uniref:Uncharacterized protein n=1 Tax=Portunus trituberculatus TaxID=210409 RepID=A0A5B7DQ13_PORTR|nr:hypothetical protein [Portunus trituberculatus]
MKLSPSLSVPSTQQEVCGRMLVSPLASPSTAWTLSPPAPPHPRTAEASQELIIYPQWPLQLYTQHLPHPT